MGLITKGMGVVLKHVKKPGKAFTRAGDKWYKKTKKLQASKKRSERIRGEMRIIAPMTVAAGVGAVSGVKSGLEIRRKETQAAGQYQPRSIIEDTKTAIKKVKHKLKKK